MNIQNQPENTLKIQYFSDIHLEGGGEAPKAVSHGDVIIAAGDIGEGLGGINWLCQFDCPVMYVLGNHEYWGQDYADFIDTVYQACEGSNVCLLENTMHRIGRVRFLGCSLWTDYNCQDTKVMQMARQMNDFKQISHQGQLLSPSILLNTHRHSLAWLKDQLQEPFDGKTVVLTHHAPSMKSWYHSPTDPYRFCYCNQLEPWLEESPIDFWVHGHTHCQQNYQVGQVQVLCNPRGLPGQGVKGFELTKQIEIGI